MQGKLNDGAHATAMVAVGEITIRDRLRPVDGSAVEALMASIEMSGLIHPIQLREVDGALVLIAGAHRLEAHKRLGRGAIRAEIRDVTDAEAELIEIEENLVEAELTTLDLATHLARQKALYEALNPGAKAGVAGAAARWGDADDTVSFASTVAAKRDISPRHVQRLTKIGEALSPEAVAALRAGEKPASYRTLADLAAEEDKRHQALAAATLAEGQVKRVSIALAIARGTVPPKGPSADEKAYDALVGAWGRAPAKSRARFMAWLWETEGDALEQALQARAAARAASDEEAA